MQSSYTMLDRNFSNMKRKKFPYLGSLVLLCISRRQMSLPVCLAVVVFELEAVALVTDFVMGLDFLKSYW